MFKQIFMRQYMYVYICKGLYFSIENFWNMEKINQAVPVHTHLAEVETKLNVHLQISVHL